MNDKIKPLVMPKWGLSMSEGKVSSWLKKEGDEINIGDEVLEVETDKIAGVVEAGDAGILRRIIGIADTIYPVKALIGVIAESDVSDHDIDAFINDYASNNQSDEEEADNEPQYLWADLAAGRIRYVIKGNGDETIVLIHGFSGDLDNWLFNIDALAEKFRVIAFDLPGHGQSTKTISDASLQGLSSVVNAFLASIDVKSAHFIGHSLGGSIALQQSVDHQYSVKSLTLIASGGLGSDINMDFINGFIKAEGRKDIKPVLELLFNDPALVNRQLINDVLNYKRVDGVQQTLQNIADKVFPNGQQSDKPVEKIDHNIPILILWGENDQIIPVKHAHNCPWAQKVEVLTEAGHMPHMEKASQANKVIIDHITQNIG